MASRYSFCYQFILDYFNFTKSASFVALECALSNCIFYQKICYLLSVYELAALC